MTNCACVFIPQRFTQQYAFPMKKNSSWLAGVNREISIADNEGSVSRLFQYYVPNNCPPVYDASHVQALTLSDLSGVFIIAAIATALSALGKLVDLAFHRKKRIARISADDRKVLTRSMSATSGTGSTGSGLSLSTFHRSARPSVVTTRHISLGLDRSNTSLHHPLDEEEKQQWVERQL